MNRLPVISKFIGLKKNISDLEMNIRKQESEKQTKDHQIRALQDEMAQQDEVRT